MLTADEIKLGVRKLLGDDGVWLTRNSERRAGSGWCTTASGRKLYGCGALSGTTTTVGRARARSGEW